MNTTESLKRLFASPGYQQMLREHREDMARRDKEAANYFRSLLNLTKPESPKP